MMQGFIPFLDVRNRTSEEALSALPDSPTRPDRPSRPLRLRISLALHRLADRLEPASPPCPDASGASPGVA